MQATQEFTGGVYHASLPNGRAAGSVDIDTAGIRVRTADGHTFVVPYEGLELELGGTGGAVVFCHGVNRETSVYTADTDFLRALAASLHTETSDKANQLLVTRIRRRWSGRGVALTIVVVLAILAMTAPTVFGWLVERTVRSLPTSIDQELGDVSIRSISGSMQVVEDSVVKDAMATILERLEQHIPDGYEKWDFRVMVVEDDSINAFALPGGQMVFHTGLLSRAGSADEVAGVMAHEMGHVLERHGLQRVGQSIGIIAAVGLIFGDTGVLVAASAEFLATAAINNYSRGDEAEADAISVEMMHGAGLDPEALSAMFERMKTEGAELPDLLHWISTHPTHDERVDAIGWQVDGLGEAERRALAIDWEAVRRALSR